MIQIHGTTERRPTASLVPYARNSRTHSDAQIDQIVESMRQWGFTNPVLIDEHGGIIAGHGRVMAATRLQVPEVPVIVAQGWSEAQRRAYVIADNKLALNSGWDEDMLAAEMAAIEAMDFDLSVTGFEGDEILNLYLRQTEGEGTEARQGNTDDDQTPEPPPQAVTRPGDVWLCGAHRVVCGDATSRADWARLSIVRPALVFSSPPYGIGENAKLRDKYVKGAATLASLYATHTDSPAEWPALMRAWTDLALANADCVVVNVQTLAQNKRNLLLWSAEYAAHLTDIAIWDKGHGAPQMQRNILTNVFEWLFILSPEADASRTVPMANFHGTESNVVRIAKGSREYADIHKATMPVALADWAIALVAGAGCVVDPFGGTGTTLIAAEKAGKAARLIELDPRYVDVIVERWQAFTEEVATLEATGQTLEAVRADRAVPEPITTTTEEIA